MSSVTNALLDKCACIDRRTWMGRDGVLDILVEWKDNCRETDKNTIVACVKDDTVVAAGGIRQYIFNLWSRLPYQYSDAVTFVVISIPTRRNASVLRTRLMPVCLFKETFALAQIVQISVPTDIQEEIKLLHEAFKVG